MSTETKLTPKYEAGEKLLCFHGPLLYEAKCLDVKVKDEGVVYFVHYQGWNKNWDEWVTDKRMFKFNEEGLKKQKELKHQIKSGKKVKMLRKSDLKRQAYPPPEIMKDIERSLKPVEENEAPKSKSVPTVLHPKEIKPEEPPSTPAVNEVKDQPKVVPTVPPPVVTEEDAPPTTQATPTVARRRKGRPGVVEAMLENDEGFLNKPQLKVELPENLKAWLVDDWDLITRQARLYELPSSCPISRLMVDFTQNTATQLKSDEVEGTAESSSPPSSVHLTSDLRHEFVVGLQHYFNLVIGSQLLYKFERLQYAELLKQHGDQRMSEIYGPMHLLRLFIKLREMVSCTRVDTNSLPVLEALVAEFLAFLQENAKRYFRLEDYTVATAEYQRRAMC